MADFSLHVIAQNECKSYRQNIGAELNSIRME